jgi:GT2 family glycosyltransferase
MIEGKIGVCILTFNSRECVVRCLRRATEALEGTSGTIVVVDNGSADGTVDLVLKGFPEVDVIENRQNLGYSAGNNIGARHLASLGCEFLAFVNPDVELEKTTLEELRSALAADPQAGDAGGVVREGALARLSFRREFTLSAALTIYSNLRYLPVIRNLLSGLIERESAKHYIDTECLKRGDEVVAVSGGCVVFKTGAFLNAGAFDERSFLYFEEYMIAHRLREAGLKVIAVPEAVYVHKGGASSANIGSDFLWRHYCASEQVYTRAYLGWRWKAKLLRFSRAADHLLAEFVAATKKLMERR